MCDPDPVIISELKVSQCILRIALFKRYLQENLDIAHSGMRNLSNRIDHLEELLAQYFFEDDVFEKE